jgi:hypothetical protein
MGGGIRAPRSPFTLLSNWIRAERSLLVGFSPYRTFRASIRISGGESGTFSERVTEVEGNGGCNGVDDGRIGEVALALEHGDSDET